MENIDIQEFKKLIKKVKFFYNIKQVDIAHTIDVTGPYLSDMINGRVPITDQVIKKIYEFYSDIKDVEVKKVQILDKKKEVPFKELLIEEKLNRLFDSLQEKNKKLNEILDQNIQIIENQEQIYDAIRANIILSELYFEKIGAALEITLSKASKDKIKGVLEKIN